MSTISITDRILPEYDQIARAVPYLAMISAIVGTTTTLWLGLRTFAIVSLYATVPILIASVTYFVTDQSFEIEQTVAYPLSWFGIKLSTVCYLLLHATAILLAAAAVVRPLTYYVLVALAATVVLFQILQSELERSHVAVILFEMSALLVSLLWSVSLKGYYFFGRTDVFPHHQYINSLLASNAVTGAFEAYEPFALWHILVAFQTMLFDNVFNPLTLSFFTTGVLYGLVPIAVYALSRRFLFSQRVSLVAALGSCLNPFVILYGMYAIPRSITSSLVVFCALLVLIGGTRSSLLYLGLLIGIAAYHTVSLPFIFVIFGCWYVVERLVSSTDAESESTAAVVSTWQLVAIPVVQLSYWLLTDPSLISRVIGLVTEQTELTTASDTPTLASQFVAAPYNELINYLVFGFIILFVLFAVIYGHRVDRFTDRNKTLLLTALLLSIVSVPGPILLVGAISNLTPDMLFRFGQYTYPFVTVAVGVGIVSVTRIRPPIGGRRVMLAVVLVLVCSATFFAVSNDFVASDNPLAERGDSYSFHLTESEATSFASISDHSESPVTSDYVTCRYVNYPGNGACNIIQADITDRQLFFPDSSVFVLRTGELEKRPLSVFPTGEPVSEPPYSNNRDSVPRESAVWDDLVEQNRIYDSAEVTGYTSAD